ncbi:MAG TPA: NAD(P)-dependent oxidoreductase [Chloroflexota bacterium]|nr:NAD(P)-dependent oxidoreductase [Chloroflexota bacterium]
MSKLLVITGAAGRIGTFYRRWLRERGALGEGDGGWRLRLVDVRPPEHAEPADDVISADKADVSDPAVAQEFARGAHTILHLAADPSPSADFYASLLDRNIKATYNVLQAARDNVVRRVVFASSVNAILGYPQQRQVRAEDVAWPGNVYGASKAWGEAVCGAFVAQSEGKLSAIAVRIGGVTDRNQIGGERRRGQWYGITVTYEDLSRLFDRCIDGAPDVTFAVVNGISNNRYLRMDLDSTRHILGYDPEDDAFAIAEERAAAQKSAPA